MTVEHEQFLGVLLKKATLSVDRRLQGCISYNAALKAPSVPSGRSARIPFAAGSGHRSQCSRRAPARAQDLRHDLAASPPMKRHGWGLDAHGVADVIFRRVDDQLMRRAGNTHRRCTAERRLMETVDVAADDSRNLGMRSNDAGELVTATKAMRVNRTDAHLKRRMVHRNQSRRRWRESKRTIKPCELGCVEFATRRTPASCRVERHQPHRPRLDRVAEWSFRGQVPVIRERIAQCVAVVMIARDEIDRHLQLGKELAEALVFLRFAAVNKIAGRDHECGAWRKRIERADCTTKIPPRANHVVKQVAFAPDVRVGDLSDEQLLLRHPNRRSGDRVRSIHAHGRTEAVEPGIRFPQRSFSETFISLTGM
jgi:predicted transcriptional regulator